MTRTLFLSILGIGPLLCLPGAAQDSTRIHTPASGHERLKLPVQPSGQPLLTRVSLSPLGGETNGLSRHPSISANGRFVVFESDSTNLGPVDTNGHIDVFLRDRDPDADGVFDEQHGPAATLLISVSTDGLQGNGRSFDPAVSKDGRHVVFISESSNLDPSDLNGQKDVYVHDRDTDGDGLFDETGAVRTTLISRANDGSLGDGLCALPKISGDGRYIAYQSSSSNLVAGDTNGVQDVFVHDRDPDDNGLFDEGNGLATLLSVNPSGRVGDGASSKATITARGRFVVFESLATDLVPGDTNGYYDVFVHDRDPDVDGELDEGNGVVRRVSLAPDGTQGNGASRRPAISTNGRHVTFESDADNLGVLDQNGFRDIYAVDLDPDGNGQFETSLFATSLINWTRTDEQTTKQSAYARISGNGRFVAYVSFANNLVSGDDNYTFDVFARDRDPDRNGLYDEGNGRTILISATADGTVGDLLSGAGELSNFGRYKVFVSDATDLLPNGDHNGLRDVYVRKIF